MSRGVLTLGPLSVARLLVARLLVARLLVARLLVARLLVARLLVATAVVAAAALAAPLSALASGQAVPGAAYTGTAAGGATVTFTVSSDGTQVISYLVLGISGTDANGATCQATAAASPPIFPGAAITNDSFNGSIETFDFTGTFDGPQSASGTFTLDLPAAGDGPGCTTGAVSWTATTTSPAPGGGGGGGGGSVGGGGSGGGGSGSGGSGGSSGSGGTPDGGSHPGTRPKPLRTRVVLHRLSATKLGGRLEASNEACRAHRRVYLWRGTKRYGSTRTTVKGAYRFKLSRSRGGQRVRVVVLALKTKGVSCGAASSTSIAA